MIFFSVVAYIALAAWYLFGGEKSRQISMLVGVCISSFLAYWYLDVNNIAMVIYIVVGIACIFFQWVSVDAAKKGGTKNKIVAALLAFFLGGCGAHRFYLRKTTLGLLYVLFCWSMIPGVIGIIEAICLLAMSQDKFNLKYNANTQRDLAHEQQLAKPISHGTNNTVLQDESIAVEDNYYTGVNERDGDNLNYRDLKLCGYRAEAVGNIENFTITIRASGKTYTFTAKDGDICSCRSSTMRGTKHYEVT